MRLPRAQHGESELNVTGHIGGDSSLSARGQLFAKQLGAFMRQENLSDLKVWTSYLRRSIETAEHVPCSAIAHWKALDELDAVSFRLQHITDITALQNHFWSTLLPYFSGNVTRI
ncbi:hypothetical protein PHET_12034 [Paragonimus heterotremus]|uniref:Uncharacterized protein n=1 Tax=Paragonimus heterotremus TaxID=100268 RepID=A0A8J4T0D1_9TREM|nr:hypothetical protein PHET_12034 [Paragonimus heterotremus]